MKNAHERLILATQTFFNLETIWMQGYATGKQDIKVNCPYDEDSKESQYWHEGFESGLFDDEPLFPDYAVDIKEERKAVNNAKFYAASFISVAAIALYGGVLFVA
jgi:hypothetical protein